MPELLAALDAFLEEHRRWRTAVCHHFASWFMMQGGSLLALKEILGHASLIMTERYAHLSPGHLKTEVAKTSARAEVGQMKW